MNGSRGARARSSSPSTLRGTRRGMAVVIRSSTAQAILEHLRLSSRPLPLAHLLTSPRFLLSAVRQPRLPGLTTGAGLHFPVRWALTPSAAWSRRSPLPGRSDPVSSSLNSRERGCRRWRWLGLRPAAQGAGGVAFQLRHAPWRLPSPSVPIVDAASLLRGGPSGHVASRRSASRRAAGRATVASSSSEGGRHADD